MFLRHFFRTSKIGHNFLQEKIWNLKILQCKGATKPYGQPIKQFDPGL